VARFKRPSHNEVLGGLKQLDAAFLEANRCYFGGGTRIVLELGEYRESRGIDFLCADVAGYRALRETISESSLGAIAKPALELARNVRADQYGVRTAVRCATLKIKLEIVREARIALDGAPVRGIPVTCLARSSCFAEKFLANADRGTDASTLSRDAVDLAFMIEGWGAADADQGAAIARAAYGRSIDRSLSQVTARLRSDKAFRARVVEGLAISNAKTLSAGLEALAKRCDAD
jgi:hypothetical protein